MQNATEEFTPYGRLHTHTHTQTHTPHSLMHLCIEAIGRLQSARWARVSQMGWLEKRRAGGSLTLSDVNGAANLSPSI